MILSVKERILFGGIFLANKDSMTEASVQRSILNAIKVDVDEAKEIELRAAKEGYVWNAIKGLDKEFAFDATQINYLKESIYTLSKAKLVTQDLIAICEKIGSSSS
jgi:hypothetical protein